MTRTILSIAIPTLFLVFSCNKINQESKNRNEGIYPEKTEKSTLKPYENIISKNIGKYAYDIDLFNENDVLDRLQKLTGTITLDEISKNFNVQTPIVSENNIYKLTGCLKNNCPAYMVTILYDSSTDNFNVIINQNNKIIAFKEKETIYLTETLKRK